MTLIFYSIVLIFALVINYQALGNLRHNLPLGRFQRNVVNDTIKFAQKMGTSYTVFRYVVHGLVLLSAINHRAWLTAPMIVAYLIVRHQVCNELRTRNWQAPAAA